MKKQNLFGRLFGLKLAEEPVMETGTPIAVHQVAIGTTGTKSFAGYPDEEYLAKLRGRRRADVFDEVRRSDPQVQMCLSAVKNPISQAVFEVTVAGQEIPGKEEHRDFIDHVLFKDPDFDFDQFIQEALTLCEFGHAVFEVTHKVVENDKRFGTFNGLQNLGWRSPRTIERWNLDSDTGKLKSISQYSYGDLNRTIDIPSQYLLVMTLQREGSNFEGISLLRSVYGCWFRKNVYLKLNAIGIEKFAVPTPIATIPNGKEGSPEKNALIDALENYTTHQCNYLIKPEGWQIELETNTYDPQKVEVSIENEDKRMAKAFLANFLELGMGTTGSYALSNDLSDFFLSGLEKITNVILGQLNKRLIPDLIKMKYGPQQAYPKVTASGISDKAGKEFADLLKVLGDGQWLKPADADEDYLRKRYKMPGRSVEGLRETKPAPSFGPQFDEGSVRGRIMLAMKKGKQ